MRVLGNIMSRRAAGYVSRLRGLKALYKLESQAGGRGLAIMGLFGGTCKQTAGWLEDASTCLCSYPTLSR